MHKYANNTANDAAFEIKRALSYPTTAVATCNGVECTPSSSSDTTFEINT